MNGTVYSFRITQEDFEIWEALEKDPELYHIPQADLTKIRTKLNEPNYWFYVSRSDNKNVAGTIVHLVPETKSAIVDRIILPKNNLEIGKVTIRGSLPWFGTKQLQSINAIVLEENTFDFDYPTHIVIPKFTKPFLLSQGFVEQNTLYFVELNVQNKATETNSYFEDISEDDLDLLQLKIKRKKYPFEIIGIAGLTYESSKTHTLYRINEDTLGVFAVRKDTPWIIEFATPMNEQFAKDVVNTLIHYGETNGFQKLVITYVSNKDSAMIQQLQQLEAKIIPTQWLKKEL